MKHFFMVIGLVLAAMSAQQAYAATTDLGMVTDNATFGNKGVNRTFSDTYTFSVPADSTTAVSITNAFVFDVGKIVNFVAKLDGNALTLDQDTDRNVLRGLFNNLAANVVHSLIITGADVGPGTSSYGGSIQIVNNSAVPVPAAIWLFGSALMGLTGLRRRQAAHA